MHSLTTSASELLSLDVGLDTLRSVYNNELIRVIANFRNIYLALASRFPVLTIKYYYVTKSDSLHPKVQRQAENIEAIIRALFSSCTAQFEFIDASKLIEMARRTPPHVFDLKVAENPISTGQLGFLCLVRLADYFSLITDESGQLLRSIFEANVRDYQGPTAVNDGIMKTLQSPDSEDFWWLNNGITILTSQANLTGKTVRMEDIQIVNGLQTSTEVYNYFRNSNGTDDPRRILVRVIVPSTEESRDRIIKATNSQTSIPVASLRATDKIQRDIEEFFQVHGLFYDRRKNYHKNAGHPTNKIITIPYLAQAVMAMILKRPDDSRARPSSLLKDDADYDQVFSKNYPLQVYLNCAKLMKRMDAALRAYEDTDLLRERNNVRWHLAMYIAVMAMKAQDFSTIKFSTLSVDDMEDGLILECLTGVWVVFRAEMASSGRNADQIAKSPGFVTSLKRHLDAVLAPQLAVV